MQVIITSVSPNCYCIVKLWLNDTAVDEHKHMGGENMLEPRKPRDILELVAYKRLTIRVFTAVDRFSHEL